MWARELWHRLDVIVVATSAGEVGHIQERLGELGGDEGEVREVGSHRRLVLAAHSTDAQLIVRVLRAEGHLAVQRPDDGPRLAEWTRRTEPLTFLDRVTVSFAWSEHDREGLPGLIELGHGGFGDGGHPSTGLIIEQLIRRIGGGERVVDVGCGSGVLGLCALELGAEGAVGVDVDAAAVQAAQRHAALNGMAGRMTATAEPLGDLHGTFDAVVANIARAGIVELASELVAKVAPAGWLAVSGISPSQCTQVADYLRPLVEVERSTSDVWSVLVLARP